MTASTTLPSRNCGSETGVFNFLIILFDFRLPNKLTLNFDIRDSPVFKISKSMRLHPLFYFLRRKFVKKPNYQEALWDVERFVASASAEANDN